MRTFSFLLGFLFLFTACGSINPYVEVNGFKIWVEIADTAEERSMGLMNREYLEEDHGMLFVWEEEGIRNFWMKNTFIPLDIIFLDKDFIVVDMQKADPCVTDVCTEYVSLKGAQYVLEINQGMSKKYGIEVGSTLLLNK